MTVRESAVNTSVAGTVATAAFTASDPRPDGRVIVTLTWPKPTWATASSAAARAGPSAAALPRSGVDRCLVSLTAMTGTD